MTVIRIQLAHPTCLSNEEWLSYSAHVADAVQATWPDADVHVTEAIDETRYAVQGGPAPVTVWAALPSIVDAAIERWGT
jgi:hypothetical protein